LNDQSRKKRLFYRVKTVRATPDTKDKLIQVAFELFHRQGYGATGVAQILRESGVHSGSLYYFFPTKEDLLIAILEWCKENLWPEIIQPVFDRISDPIERIFGVLDGYRQMLIMTDCTHGCPMGNFTLELADRHPAIRRLVAENFSGWTRAIEQCVREAADRLPAETSSDQLALFVLTTMEGGVMLARAYKSLDPFDLAVTQLRTYFDYLQRDATGWSAPRP
jgi:AcrR family transcriptional regulator